MLSVPAAVSLALAAASAVSCHFTLDFPPSRGFDEDIEPQFCGGFNDPSVNRTLYPLSGGPLSIDSHHTTAQAVVVISFDANPTDFNDFNTTADGTNYAPLVASWTMSTAGVFCIDTNITALNVAGVGNGTNATIQVVFNGGDGLLYQCADITLSSSVDLSNITCANGTSPDSGDSDDDAASSTVASAPATTASQGAAPAAASPTGAASMSTKVGSGLLASFFAVALYMVHA